jgi:type IV pilus assembly protein PilC
MSLGPFLYRVLGYEIRVRRPETRRLRIYLLQTLFRELAFAVRQKCPLDLTLRSMCEHKTLRFGRDCLYGGAVTLAVIIAAALALIGWPAVIFLCAIVPLVVAKMLSALPGEKAIRDVAFRLAEWIAEGRTLSDAMACMPRIFTPQQCKAVAIGEETGHLAESLEALADYCEMSGQIDQIRSALMYPITLLFVAGMMLGFVVTRIVPKLRDLFAQIGADLPEFSQRIFFAYGSPFHLTNPLIWLSLLLVILIVMFIVNRMLGGGARVAWRLFIAAALVSAWTWRPLVRESIEIRQFMLVVLAAILAILVIRHSTRGRAPLLPAAARVAVARAIGRILPFWKVHLSRFLFSLGVSLRAKIPVPEALEWAGETVRGGLRFEAPRFRALVEQGHSLSDALKSSPWFRGHVAAVLSLAEWNGSFPEDCIQLANELDVEVEGQMARLAALSEYVANVLLGIFLGLFVIACYLPLFYIPRLVQ